LGLVADRLGGLERDDRQCGADPHEDAFRAGIFHPEHLRGQVFFIRLHRGFFGGLHLVSCQALPQTGQAAFSKHIVLVNDADLLVFEFFHGILGDNARLILKQGVRAVTVKARHAVFVPVGHRVERGGPRNDPEHFIGRQIIFHCVPSGAGNAAGKGKDAVFVHQLLDHHLGHRRTVLIIPNKIFDFAAVDAAFRVHNFSQQSAAARHRAPGCGRTCLGAELGNANFFVIKTGIGCSTSRDCHYKG